MAKNFSGKNLLLGRAFIEIAMSSLWYSLIQTISIAVFCKTG